MRISSFYQAFLICIRAIESGDPSLLIDIDPKLVWTSTEAEKDSHHGFRFSRWPVSSVLHRSTKSFTDQIPPSYSLVWSVRDHRSQSSTVPLIRNSQVRNYSSVDPCVHRHVLDSMATFRTLHRRNRSEPAFCPDETKDVRKRFPSQFSSARDSWDFLSLADSSLSLEQSLSRDEHRFSIYSQNTLLDSDEPSTPADFTPITESGMMENSTNKGENFSLFKENPPAALVCLIILPF